MARETVRRTGEDIYTLGPLIHNARVVAALREEGIIPISPVSIEALPRGKTVVVRSHGAGPSVYAGLDEMGCQVVDATCPQVLKAQQLASEYIRNDYQVLILGDPDHPEVKSYQEWSCDRCIVLQSERELDNVVLGSRLAVMAQTTESRQRFARLIECIRDKGYEPSVLATICSATEERVLAAEELAPGVDAFLVAGDRGSSNTTKLREFCQNQGKKAWIVESAGEIKSEWFDGIETVGITAGASTPEWIIKEVMDKMEEFKDQELENRSDQDMEEGMNQDMGEITNQNTEENLNQYTEENSDQNSETNMTQDAAEDSAAEGVTARDAEESAGRIAGDSTGRDVGDGPVEESSMEESSAEENASLDAGDSVSAAESGTAREAEAGSVKDDSAEDGSVKDGPAEAGADRDDEDGAGEGSFSEMEAEMGCREFNPGDIVTGTVVKISSDEILVDIGHKSEGVIPASELAFTKVDPLTFFQIGDEIKCEVLKEDREGNIVLSHKNVIFEERLTKLEESYEKDEIIEAPVIEVVKGGLLVDVGIRGFVPASQVSRSFVKNLNDYLHQTLRMRIIELNKSARKVVLSQRTVLETEYKTKKEAFWKSIQEGEVRKGVVRRLTAFGAFVDLGGVDGLLHVSEMGWGKVNEPKDVVSINDEIEVFILKTDREKEKVSLGLKQLLPNPWDTLGSKYPAGKTFKGKVMRIVAFGAFIELEPGVEGLAHISHLANYRVAKVEDVLTVGQQVDVKILEVDLERRRVSLSVKDAEADREAEEVRRALDEQPEAESATVADALENAAAKTADAPEMALEQPLEETDGGEAGFDEDESDEE
jgi:4-hydroxy-3-methylbut-2-enyl diphosphate reductase